MGPTTNHRWSYAAAKALFERYLLAHNQENGLPFTIIPAVQLVRTENGLHPGT